MKEISNLTVRAFSQKEKSQNTAIMSFTINWTAVAQVSGIQAFRYGDLLWRLHQAGGFGPHLLFVIKQLDAHPGSDSWPCLTFCGEPSQPKCAPGGQE